MRWLNKVGKIVNLATEMTENEPAEEPILELSATTKLSDYVSAILHRRGFANAWSPIGNTFAAACCNGEVHLIRSFVGMMLCPPTDNSLAKPSLGEIDALAFSFDGRWLAAGGLDGNISLWKVDGNIPELFDTIETGSWVYRLVWSPTCNHLAFNLGKSVQIWDADRSEVATNLPGAATPQDLRWSPDGNHLAVATKNDIHI